MDFLMTSRSSRLKHGRVLLGLLAASALGGVFLLLLSVAAEAGPLDSSNPAVHRGNDWHLREALSAGNADSTFSFGTSNDIPLFCDWDGDGNAYPVVFRDSTATWFLQDGYESGSAAMSFSYGQSGDVPVCGDWNDDGKDTPGVVRGNTWLLKNSNGPGSNDIASFSYGKTTDEPIVGDWDNDGDDTPGVFRSSNASFHLRNSTSGGAADESFNYGSGSDDPITGDWDGDGQTTVGVARDSSKSWFLTNSHSTGSADRSFNYGATGDTPLVWDGQLPVAGAGVGATKSLTTPRPDLRSAEIVQFDPSTSAREQVEFCYDEVISSTRDIRFDLQGFDSDNQLQRPLNSAVSSSDPSCALAEYPGGTFLPAYSIGVSEFDAATGSGGTGDENLMDSVPLLNNPLKNFEGKTAAPDLIDVKTNTTLNHATYIFDDQIDDDDCAGGTAGDLDVELLGFYDSSGTKTNVDDPTDCVSQDVNKVTVDFGPTGESVADAVRFFAEYDAVEDTDDENSAVGPVEANPEGVVSASGATSRPDLIDVRQGPSKSQYDFEFDEALDSTTLDESGFFVYADCAVEEDLASKASDDCVPGQSSAKLLPGGKVVRVDFFVPAFFGEFPTESITLATVEPDAAESATDPGEEVSIGAIAIQQTNQGPGFTDGPDLIDAEFRDGPDEVLFIFDEPLDECPGCVDPDHAAVIDSSGGTTSGISALDVDGNEALIDFPSGTVSGAIGASVTNGVTEDTYGPGGGRLLEDKFFQQNSPTAIGR